MKIMNPADRENLEKDYQSGEVSRAEAKRYPLVHRGSIRLVQDLYRTEQEQREFIAHGLSVRLPGQKGHREQSQFTRTLSYLFRSIFRR